MSLYNYRMKAALKNNRDNIKKLEKHKDFYPLIEELQEVFDRYFWVQQTTDYIYCSTYLKDEDDKTLPLLMEEFILGKDWIEEAKPSKSYKEQGEIVFYFNSNKPRFGSGERPMFHLSVNYSNLCKRVVTGTRTVEDYEYKCD